ASSLVYDGAGNLYLAGVFMAPLSFDATNLVPSNIEDIFVTKLDSSGRVLWAKQAGGTKTDRVFDLELDKTGHLYISGMAQQSYFGTKPFTGGGFIAKMDTAG